MKFVYHSSWKNYRETEHMITRKLDYAATGPSWARARAGVMDVQKTPHALAWSMIFHQINFENIWTNYYCNGKSETSRGPSVLSPG